MCFVNVTQEGIEQIFIYYILLILANMTDFIPIFSSLWTINPPVSKERQKCIALYKQLDLLLEKSNDTHIIVKTIMKLDHVIIY